MASRGGVSRQQQPDNEDLPTLHAELLACLRSGIATTAVAQHLMSLSEHVVCASVSHRAPRDATSGQDMVDEHYNFAVQGTLGRMPWPANQTLAADVMLKGKARRFNLESSTDPIRFRDASFAAGLYKTPLLVCAPLPCHSPVHCNEDASGYCVVCGRLPTADAISLGAMTVGVAPGAGSISSATQQVMHRLQRWAAYLGPRLAKDLPTRFTTATQPPMLRPSANPLPTPPEREQSQLVPARSMPRATLSGSEPSSHTMLIAEQGWPQGGGGGGGATTQLQPIMAALLQGGGASALLPPFRGNTAPAMLGQSSSASFDSLLQSAQQPAMSSTSSAMQSLLAVLQPPPPLPPPAAMPMQVPPEQQRQLLQVLQSMFSGGTASGGAAGAQPGGMVPGPPPHAGRPPMRTLNRPTAPAQLHATTRPELARDMSERARLLDQLAQLARQGPPVAEQSPTLALSQTRKRERGIVPRANPPKSGPSRTTPPSTTGASNSVPPRPAQGSNQEPADPPVRERGSTVDSDLDDSGDSGPSVLQSGAGGSRSGRVRRRKDIKGEDGDDDGRGEQETGRAPSAGVSGVPEAADPPHSGDKDEK